MIERYSREETKKIWELQSKFKYFLDVEIAVCSAYCDLGVIPRESFEHIKSRAKFDLNRIEELEKVLKHDVIAFLTNVNESVGENSRFIHMGLTSSDVIDTALALQLKDVNKIIKANLDSLIVSLKHLANKHKRTICIGRSHGVHAEPMTFGVKVLTWVDFFEKALARFDRACREIEIGQISGPVGTYSNIDPEIERLACEKLGLRPAKISTQVVSRDNHAHYMHTLALIASAIEFCSVEIRHLQRTEVLEVEEGFSTGQKGSSAMPHKKNPISSENLSGLARVVKANSIAALDNIVLWHERDISHSSVERIILPDSTILIDYMLNRFESVVKNLVIHEKNMLKNTNLFGGIVFSQKVLLELTNAGCSREEAYELVQRNALGAFNNEDGNFKNNLLADEKIMSLLSNDQVKKCFDMDEYLKNIDGIFAKFAGLPAS